MTAISAEPSTDAIDDRELVPAICRANFCVFARQAFTELYPGVRFDDAPYIEALCFAIQEVAEGRDLRLNINVPPRHLKSFLVSIALPAWMMGRDPSFKVLFAAYGQDLADEHARSFLKLVKSQFFRTLFPEFKLLRTAIGEVSTTAGGFRRATGAAGSITGFGADLIVIDDLSKVGDAHSPATLEAAQNLYRETVLSRFNDKSTGRLIAIQQRIHENDLSGLLLGADGFKHIVLPSIAEERQVFPVYTNRQFTREPGDLLNSARENRETLDRLRREMGDAAFSSQYQQNPIPPGGNRIRWDWFERYHVAPSRGRMQYVVQSWDTAINALPTNDWSVCVTCGFVDGRWLVLDVYRARHDYPDLRRAAKRLAREWRPELVLIENAGTGLPLCRDLREDQTLQNISFNAITPRISKDVRLEAQTAQLEDGLVKLPHEAPWLDTFRHELLGFPNARHDDQVDAFIQFAEWATGRRAQSELEVAKYGRVQSIERRP